MMRKKLFLFVTVFFPAATLAQSVETDLVLLEVGNKYIYEFAYAYQGGNSGSEPAYTMDIVGDTTIAGLFYYKGEVSGNIDATYYPVVDYSEQDTTFNIYMRSEFWIFEILDKNGELIFFFDAEFEVAESQKIGELSARELGYESEVWDTRGWEMYTPAGLFGKEVNFLVLRVDYGFTGITNVDESGSESLYLTNARVNGRIIGGDTTLVSTEFEYSEDISEFTLTQNYPNPFNPSTNISYSVSKNSQVELKVFNVLGTEVATLANAFQPAGAYNVVFDGAGLGSGIYIYRLRVGDKAITKKMLLLK